MKFAFRCDTVHFYVSLHNIRYLSKDSLHIRIASTFLPGAFFEIPQCLVMEDLKMYPFPLDLSVSVCPSAHIPGPCNVLVIES